jgi:putative serine protease PepD
VTSRAVLIPAAALAIGLAGAQAPGALVSTRVAPAKTKTVVMNTTTVDHSQPASASSGLSINAIYQRTYQGVVDITVRRRRASRRSAVAAAARARPRVRLRLRQARRHHHEPARRRRRDLDHRQFWNGRPTGDARRHRRSTDLAVIKVDAPSSLLHPLTLGDSTSVQVGDGVSRSAARSASRRPSRAASSARSTARWTRRTTSRSTTRSRPTRDQPRQLGRPAARRRGQVIGVNAQIESDSGGNDGVGFAIPSNTVKSVVSQIAAGKTVAHAYLGVSIRRRPPVRAPRSPPSSQARRRPRPASRSATWSSGRRHDDASPDDLSRIIDAKKPGDSLSVTYVRSGKQHTVTLQLGTRPS